MLQLRPTFSESWYRVAGLKAKLRPSAQISRQFYRGERWYVVRDPAGNQFHRLSDAAYRFVALLDGRRTVQEAWDLVGGQLEDDAPTQPEVIHILSQLHGANLLEADITPDSAVLLRRHKQMQKRQWQGRMMNLLFPRIPLWDPDRFIQRWMPLMRPILSWVGGLVWLGLIVTVLVLLTPEMGRLQAAASNAIDPSNWLWLWAVFVGIKLVHELGHAFMCRRFGGEVHEMGVMFLVLVPAPYVEASTAWAFPSRWQRMLVGAAGMIFELFIAAIAALIWLNTSPAETINRLAYNAMLVASVTTLLFNANPLLRYDGYYMLSDFLEIPNLRQRSTEYAMGLIKRHIFRIKARDPLPPPMQRIWLFTYAIASAIYRVFIGIMIIVVVAYKVPILGQLMAVGGVITWLFLPLFKTFKYLAVEPELHRKRGRAVAFSLATAAAVILLVGIIKFPDHIGAQGIVEPGVKDVIKAGMAGTVSQILVHDGQWVKGPVKDASGKILEPGQVLLVMQDEELNSKVRAATAQVETLRRALQQAVVNDQAMRQSLANQLEMAQKQLEEWHRRQGELTVRATIDGQVIAPQLHEKLGMHLPRGTELAMVARTETVLVRANVDQHDYQWILKSDKKEPRIRLVTQLDKTLRGEQVKFLPAASEELVHGSMTAAGGGQVEADPRDETARRAKTPQFEMQVRLDNADGALMPGQRAYVRCDLDSSPLIERWANRFMQLLQAQGDPEWLKYAGGLTR